jgi:hypothetical protein
VLCPIQASEAAGGASPRVRSLHPGIRDPVNKRRTQTCNYCSAVISDALSTPAYCTNHLDHCDLCPKEAHDELRKALMANVPNTTAPPPKGVAPVVSVADCLTDSRRC